MPRDPNKLGLAGAATEALQNLVEGNLRFFTGTQRHPNQSPARRYEIAGRQQPFAAILACADSRIAPEIILDQGLGDLFVVRVAGNVADPLVIETLDLAVKDVGIRLILVLGHTRCAAITKAVTSDRSGAESPMRRALIAPLRAARQMSGDMVANAIRENVRLTVQLLRASNEFAAMVDQGMLSIVGAVYDLDTGRVTIRDGSPRNDEASEEADS